MNCKLITVTPEMERRRDMTYYWWIFPDGYLCVYPELTAEALQELEAAHGTLVRKEPAR